MDIRPWLFHPFVSLRVWTNCLFYWVHASFKSSSGFFFRAFSFWIVLSSYTQCFAFRCSSLSPTIWIKQSTAIPNKYRQLTNFDAHIYNTKWESAPRRLELPESTELVTVPLCVNCCARLKCRSTRRTDVSFAVKIPSSASVLGSGIADRATRPWPVVVTHSVLLLPWLYDLPLDVFVVFRSNLHKRIIVVTHNDAFLRDAHDAKKVISQPAGIV